MLDKEQIGQIRQFNRQYTKALMVFNRKIFGTGLSWAEARIVIEVGLNHLNSPSLLSKKLKMDKSYVSRIVNKLVQKNYLLKTSSPKDSRAVELEFTNEGRQLFQKIDERSDDLIEDIIKDLSPAEQKEFLHSIQIADRLLFQKGVH